MVAEKSLTSYQHDDFVDSLKHTHADFSLSQRESEVVACLLVNPHKINLETCFPRTLDLNAVVKKMPKLFLVVIFFHHEMAENRRYIYHCLPDDA